MAVNRNLSISAVAEIMRNNYNTFDNGTMYSTRPLGSWNDNACGPEDFIEVLAKSELRQDVRDAAASLLAHPEFFQQLQYRGGSQAYIQKQDVDAFS
jgi:hypothetical protein